MYKKLTYVSLHLPAILLFSYGFDLRFSNLYGLVSQNFYAIVDISTFVNRSLYLQYQRKLVEQVDDERVRFEVGTISDFEVCCLFHCIIIMVKQIFSVNY